MTVASTTARAEHISRPLTLGAIDTSPRTARVVARSLLAEWGLAGLADSVELVVGELVTNAVYASMGHDMPRSVQFRISARGSCVLVEVWDDDPGVPIVQEQMRTDSENGRGLLLVASVSARWGWKRLQKGKVVWAEVREDEH
jgi:anti-sigma regulatory factor (Ser/Thr protein kinase)